MSISDTTSRINIMNIDCLLHICESITQRVPGIPHPDSGLGRRTHETRPHNDIRAVSQVCRRWREALLSSPRIWGRVIDFGVQAYSLPNYRPKRGEWLEEVLKRAGSAVPLWITGDVGPFYVRAGTTDFGFDAMSFFIRLLESQWERIEVLSVSIGLAKSTQLEAVQTQFFCRAPVLKHFEVLCHGSPGWDFSPEEVHFVSPQKLFANYAPSLRTMNAEDIPFDMDSPWISGIREMVPLPTTLTINEVIVLLQRMPIIEEFQLAHYFSDSDLITPNPTLHLPNLTSLIFNNDSIASTAKMMECLSMDRLSGLTIKLIIEEYGPMMDSNPDILLTFKNTLAQYICNYFVSKPSIRNVNLWSNTWCLSFDDISSKDRSSRWQSQKLDLDLGCYGRGSDEDKREVILSMLDVIPLASTQKGHLDASNDLFGSIDELTLSLTDTPVTIFPNLRLALAQFHHIRLLKLTDHHCVESFLSIYISDQTGNADDHDRGVVFPELHTLWIDDWQGDVAGKAHPSLTDFLLQRKKIGYPITRLDLSAYPRADAPDLDRLNKVDGLEVIWKQGKIKSGNGMRWWGSYIY